MSVEVYVTLSSGEQFPFDVSTREGYTVRKLAKDIAKECGKTERVELWLEGRKLGSDETVADLALARHDAIIGVIPEEANEEDVQRDVDTMRIAVKDGDMETVRKLLDDNVPCSTPDLVHDACKHNYPVILEALLSKGASTKTRDLSGNTPLITASYHNSLHCMAVLLRFGAAPAAKCPIGRNALHYVYRWNETDGKMPVRSYNRVKIMSKFPAACFGAKDRHGCTPLHYVAAYSQDRLLFEEMPHKNVSSEVRNKAGHYPIHTAARAKNAVMVGLLAAFCPKDVNTLDSEWNRPTHIAASNGDIASLRALLSFQPHLKEKNMNGKTAMDLCQAAEAKRLLRGYLEKPPAKEVRVECECAIM